MIKKIIPLIAIVLLGVMASCKDSDKQAIRYADVPAGVKSYMSSAFGGEKIASVVKELDRDGTEYTIRLVNGTKIELDSIGNMEEISNKTQPISEKALPAVVKDYVAANYANIGVREVESGVKGYKVKMDNGIKFKMSNDGTIVKKD